MKRGFPWVKPRLVIRGFSQTEISRSWNSRSIENYTSLITASSRLCGRLARSSNFHLQFVGASHYCFSSALFFAAMTLKRISPSSFKSTFAPLGSLKAISKESTAVYISNQTFLLTRSGVRGKSFHARAILRVSDGKFPRISITDARREAPDRSTARHRTGKVT